MTIKKLNIFLVVALSGWLLLSCEQDIQISNNGESYPVIYAIINPADTIHFIRISHSFKGSSIASESANNPDSICYETLAPKIEFYTESGWKYHELKFLPVQNPAREVGYFTNQGLQLYQCQSDISSFFIKGTNLVLNISVGQQRLISASVDYLEPPKIFAPRQGLRSLLEFYALPFEIGFEDLIGFARYEAHIVFHFMAVMKNGDTVKQMVDKSFIRNTQNGHFSSEYKNISIYVPGDEFLAQIRQDVKDDPRVDYRLPGEIEVYLYTGSPDFYDYVDLNKISDDFGGKIVTNITGGLGVFALKYHKKVTNIFMGPITLIKARSFYSFSKV
ncbi:MAG: DUF4249 family protein [Porphyromonadaceae bacterium]|nr:MAG: DUF4249 family protein [Porphyromonadaceae bacterium]